MDIAKIRQKAKTREAPSPAKATLRTPLPASPVAVPPATTDSVQTPPSPDKKNRSAASAVSPVDPLAALFETPLEVQLATEENYLQGLRQTTEEVGKLRQLLAFSLGTEDYVLDIETIREIIKPREVTDIPRVPEFILGIISLRGIIIPVFDLKRRLKLGKTEITPASRIVVCQHQDRVVGLLVDSITQVVRIPGQKIEPPPAVLSGLDRDLVEGVGRYNGKMMILLHLPCVVDAELV